MSLENDVLRMAQLKLLEALKELDTICSKNEINYWLDAGSLLGARRHGGFIPWDDDIDICMLRADYNRFLTLCNKELDKSKYFLQTAETDELYRTINIPCKLRVKGTKIIEKSEIEYGYYEEKCEHGVFIDIFPYDKYSSNFFIRNYIERILSVLFRAKYLRYCKNTKSTLHSVAKSIGFILPKRFLLRLVDLISELMNRRKNNFVYSAGIETPFKRAQFTHREIFPLGKIDFDGVAVKCPNDVHTYLTKMFGEKYMELPSVQYRVSHYKFLSV